MRLNGKRVLVSGGSNGIGRSLVEGFYREGASVFFSYLNDAQSAERLCSVRNRRSVGSISAMRCDLADQKETRTLVVSAIEALGHIDVLVNNAAAFTRPAGLNVTGMA
ncbi:putative oxidoreductase YghA [compost metagenome]